MFKRWQFSLKGVAVAISLLVIGVFAQMMVSNANDIAPNAIMHVADSGVASYVEEVNTSTGKTILKYDLDTSLLRFDNSAYSKLKTSDKRKWMEYALNFVAHSSIGGKSKTKVYNFISDQDTVISSVIRKMWTDVNADYMSGWKFIRPFTGVLNTVLGIFVWFVMVGFMFRLVVDTMYLSDNPVFDFAVGRSVKKPFILSRTAWAVNTQLPSASSSERLMLYLKKSALSVLLISFLVVYLVSGRIFELILIVSDMITGLL